MVGWLWLKKKNKYQKTCIKVRATYVQYRGSLNTLSIHLPGALRNFVRDGWQPMTPPPSPQAHQLPITNPFLQNSTE